MRGVYWGSKQTGVHKKQIHRCTGEYQTSSYHLRACFHLHDQMSSAFQLQTRTARFLVPASQDGSVAPYEEHACRFTSIATSSSKLVAVTRCVHRRRKLLLLLCGEEEAPRWPIYRPDLDADVTQQSGTVCAAAALTGVYRTAADCCIEVRSHLPRLEVFSLRDRGK